MPIRPGDSLDSSALKETSVRRILFDVGSVALFRSVLCVAFFGSSIPCLVSVRLHLLCFDSRVGSAAYDLTCLTPYVFETQLYPEPRVAGENNFHLERRKLQEQFGNWRLGAGWEANNKRGLKWQETNTTRQPNTTKTQPRHIVPPLNIMARATMPRARNTPPVQSNIHRPPTSIVIRPTQRVSSRNNDKEARFTPGLFI
jgi:hypothetical protein